MTWSVRVGSRSLRWQSMRVRRAVETPVSEAQVLLIDDPLSLLGANATVHDGQTLRITGVIEATRGVVTRGFNATIRSSTAALDVWQSPRNELFKRNAGESARTHADIAGSIAGKVGVAVAPEGAQRSISRFRLKRRETLLSALQRLAAAGTWVLTDDELGRIVLYEYTGAPAVAVWQLDGHPLLEVEDRDQSIDEWRDVIVVAGQRIAVSTDGGPDADAADDQISDTFVATRFENRPSQLVMDTKTGTSKADAIKQALWEANRRVGQSLSVPVSLAYWDRNPGEVVRLRDRTNALDQDFIIESIEANITATSETYGARLVSPLVYDTRPLRAELPRL